MQVFQNVLWGYKLNYPDGWIHHNREMIEAFVAIPAALDEDYTGAQSGQVMVRCEWNPYGRPIGPIWTKQVGMMASWLGAKKVGSAPWRIGEAVGLEAEIQLPQKDQRRLWSGVLAHQGVVFNFVVLHLKEERAIFEPIATQIIASLQFPPEMPPGYAPSPAPDFSDDIPNPQHWRAYNGRAGADALQAFYVREAPRFGWQIGEYVPYPGTSDLGFARFRFEKDGRSITLGILPYQDEPQAQAPYGRLAFKLA